MTAAFSEKTLAEHCLKAASILILGKLTLRQLLTGTSMLIDATLKKKKKLKVR